MKKRALACLLCILLILPCLPVFGSLAAEEKEITIIAASDYQPKNGATSGKTQLTKIVKSIIAAGVTKADALLYCGDYTNSHGSLSASTDGMSAVSSVFSPLVKKKDILFVQGNHDIMSGGSGLTLSGNNDPESGEYGVFVINNDDYMWYNTDHNTVKHTAQHLIEYLNEKIEVGYDRPIFVLSHLPLHYSMRTKLEGDARYSMYLLDALNKAAGKGLNIVYLFGHDHSNGWDDYLGGSCVYLPKGDKIRVAKSGSTSSTVEKELKFNYMNAGYTGYYSNENGSDGTLTATVLKIKGDEITITRYDGEGVHNLKSAGVRNELKGETAYDPNTTVYPSPQVVKLTKVTNNEPIKDLLDIDRSGKTYKRLTNTALIEDGKEYLIVCNTATDQIVVPKNVTKSNGEGTRKGLGIEKTTDFSRATAYGDFDEYLFTFKKTSNGWIIMKDGKSLTMKETSAFAITLTLEEGEGTPFTAGYTVGGFSFKNGKSAWNYNARGLVNCHESVSGFYLYEYVGSSVTVQNGTAKVNSNEAVGAKEGEIVTLSANKFIGGKLFEKFEVLSGDITVEMKEGTTTGSFKMPAGPVSVKAVYKDHTHAFTEKVENASYKAEGDNYYLSCACGLSSEGTEGEQTFLSASAAPTPPADKGDKQDGNNDTVIIIVGVVAVVAIVAVAATVVIVASKKKKPAPEAK
ncbi:MAG: metallophosphoesterase [Clostridia bacterium]|nr:metallophosphoesterase [Clostridia bacterium]